MGKHAGRETAGQRLRVEGADAVGTIAPALLIQLFARFRSSRPDVRLELIDGTAQSVEEQLVASAAEIAIYCRPDRAPDSRLNYLPLFREQMMIVLPSSTVWSREIRSRYQISPANTTSSGRSVSSTTLSTVCSTRAASTAKLSTVANRDDWVLAMIASGFGFGFFPKYSISNPDVVARPLVNPEFWREVSLTTVKGRPYSRAVGALVHEAMRSAWLGDVPLAVKNLSAEEADSDE
jgi:LysR family transcriptional regulator, hydrogen peroxide-inducible genes activator